jgi:hypothetical protein
VFEVEFPSLVLLDTLRWSLTFKLAAGSVLPSYTLTVQSATDAAYADVATGLAVLSLLPPMEGTGERKHTLSLFLPIATRRLRFVFTVAQQAAAGDSSASALVSMAMCPLGLKESNAAVRLSRFSLLLFVNLRRRSHLPFVSRIYLC